MSNLHKFVGSLGLTMDVLRNIENGTTAGEAKKMQEHHHDFIYNIAHSRYISERYTEARQLFEYLCLHNPTNDKYLGGLGSCIYELGDDKELELAFNILKIAHKSSEKQNPYVLYSMGSVLEKQGKDVEAKKVFTLLNKIGDLTKSKDSVFQLCKAKLF